VRTEDELRKLQADGIPASAHVWVTHNFSHVGASCDELAKFREALAANGFGTSSDRHPDPIGSDEEVEGDGYWHHYAFTVVEASPGSLRLMNEKAGQTAKQHGVQYNGWAVQRNARTQAPRLADDG
jgi:hypothetical protein